MKKQPAPRVTVNYGQCELFSTEPMVCPLCGVTVPANTPHRCENPWMQKPARQERQP